MNYPGVKAGLVGAVAAIVLNLVGLIPAIGCISLPLQLVSYIAVGVLAAYWLTPRRQPGAGAGHGAVAGLICGLVGAIASVASVPLGLAVSGGPQAIISQLPPASLQALTDAGIDPVMLVNSGTLAGLTALCCIPTGLIIGAGLGALGGLIFAAAKPE